MMNDIAHALGYLSGAVGIGFAAAFGMYAGIKAASHFFGPLNVNVGPIRIKASE
jgi:hypothetical protein